MPARGVPGGAVPRLGVDDPELAEGLRQSARERVREGVVRPLRTLRYAGYTSSFVAQQLPAKGLDVNEMQSQSNTRVRGHQQSGIYRLVLLLANALCS